MKHLFSVFFLLFLFFENSRAQNYVQNPGFELMDTCGALNRAHDGVIDDVANHCLGWNSAKGSPDMYATCGDFQTTDIPNNAVGSQTTHQGTRYCGAIELDGYQDYYELFGNQLLAPLQIGLSYEVSFYASKAEVSNWGCNNLGAVFTTAQYSSLSNPYMQRNFSHIRDSTIVVDEAGWTRISGTFTADSAYTFMILGNLYDLAHTQIISGLAYPGDNFCYYYIDDVCVVPLGGDCSIQVSVSLLNID